MTSTKRNNFSRRKILPLMGIGLLLPLFGFGNSKKHKIDPNETYETLLKPDGTVVKIKTGSLKKSQIVEKNLSNESLLKWLGRKL